MKGERDSVCVCGGVCEKERERGRETDKIMIKYSTGQWELAHTHSQSALKYAGGHHVSMCAINDGLN